MSKGSPWARLGGLLRTLLAEAVAGRSRTNPSILVWQPRQVEPLVDILCRGPSCWEEAAAPADCLFNLECRQDIHCAAIYDGDEARAQAAFFDARKESLGLSVAGRAIQHLLAVGVLHRPRAIP